MNQSSIDKLSIQDQVKLPVQVALQVVLQGMRIRFGRSLVTIMGVVLGIAFLMSIMTAQLLKRGVASEQKARMEISRMNNFLKAEIGQPSGKTLGVLQVGTLNDLEERFLRSLVDADVTALHWVPTDAPAQAQEERVMELANTVLVKVEIANIVQSGDFILLMGEVHPGSALWPRLDGTANLLRVGTTRVVDMEPLPAAIQITALARKLRPEEIAKQEAEARKEHFRNVWIIVISLLVTVIGIANAMLMSVTERFREIGTMKCLGALSAFIRQIFLFESCLIGAVGGLLGSLAGALFSILIYAFTFGFGVVMASLNASRGALVADLLLAFAAGIILSIIAAIYPATVASRMVPAHALRSNI